jgi:hypothetical protein
MALAAPVVCWAARGITCRWRNNLSPAADGRPVRVYSVSTYDASALGTTSTVSQMMPRHPLLRRHTAEHGGLLMVISLHSHKVV